MFTLIMKTPILNILILKLLLISKISGDSNFESENSCDNNPFCMGESSPEISEDISSPHSAALKLNLLKSQTTSTTERISTTKEPHTHFGKNIFKRKKTAIKKQPHEFCECDLTVNTCDINCCCDLDCSDFKKKVFSYCKDDEIEKEIDSWDCSKRPFFRKDDTRFILEKIADSLFCVADDNSPPVYTITTHYNIRDEKDIKTITKNDKHAKFKWRFDTKKTRLQELNISNYKEGDLIWKGDHFLQPIAVPTYGFGQICDYEKNIKFLENWKSSCIQHQLNDDNNYLFPSKYTNFTLVAVPSKFNSSISIRECLPPVCQIGNITYCQETWDICQSNSLNKSSEYCLNGTCYNVAKNIRYIFTHNGTEGIKTFDIFIEIFNTSRPFEQAFEIIFKWTNDAEFIIKRSGNPGYSIGSPMFIGSLSVNKSGDTEVSFITFNETQQHLTLPMTEKNGDCSYSNRYTVNFGENIKIKCSLRAVTSNFTTSTCIKLQNQTYEFMNSMLINFEKNDLQKIFVSKYGNVTETDVKAWVNLLLEKLPDNVITAQLLNDEIHCSGLINSVIFDIVHSLKQKSGPVEYHEIIAVGISFSPEVDMKWPKCKGKNCEDVLKVDFTNFVSFHDITKPKRYHIAGGPNLDISLPYDFFYPFLSDAKTSDASIINFKTVTQFFLVALVILF